MLILLVTQVTKVKGQVFLSLIMLVPQEEDTVVEEADLIQDIIQVWPISIYTTTLHYKQEAYICTFSIWPSISSTTNLTWNVLSFTI
jgi:hypothetical protein